MSYLRFRMELAVKMPIPEALQERLPEIKAAIKNLKGYAEKINEGQLNEENTNWAAYHICRHDEGQPCDPWVEI